MAAAENNTDHRTVLKNTALISDTIARGENIYISTHGIPKTEELFKKNANPNHFFKEVPENITFSDSKKKPVKRKKVTVVEEPKAQYGLFNEVATEVKENIKLTIKRFNCAYCSR